MNINQRIKEILNHYHLKQKEFADKVGVTPGAISKIIKNLSVPSGDLLESILEQFPEISAEWFMRGKGEIKISSGKQNNPNDYEDLKKDIRKILQRLDDIEENLEGEL